MAPDDPESAGSAQAAPRDPFDIDWESVETQIHELRQKLNRIGTVNLDAIGEQDELVATLFELLRLPADFPVGWATGSG